MSASYEVRDGVAVIALNNPPVNGLSYETRRAIADGLNKAQADAAVQAIVLTGSGKAFSGGADIREFGSPKSVAEPNLLTLDPHDRGVAPSRWSRPSTAWHGRRPRARARLPLPRGGAQGADRAARGEDRPDPRRRRHAAPAARARGRDGTQHDRQRRAGAERRAGRAAGPEAVRQDGRWRRGRGRDRVREVGGRQAAAAARARSQGRRTPTPMRTSSSRATPSRRWPRTSRRRPSASMRCRPR